MRNFIAINCLVFAVSVFKPVLSNDFYTYPSQNLVLEVSNKTGSELFQTKITQNKNNDKIDFKEISRCDDKTGMPCDDFKMGNFSIDFKNQEFIHNGKIFSFPAKLKNWKSEIFEITEIMKNDLLFSEKRVFNQSTHYTYADLFKMYDFIENNISSVLEIFARNGNVGPRLVDSIEDFITPLIEKLGSCPVRALGVRNKQEYAFDSNCKIEVPKNPWFNITKFNETAFFHTKDSFRFHQNGYVSYRKTTYSLTNKVGRCLIKDFCKHTSVLRMGSVGNHLENNSLLSHGARKRDNKRHSGSLGNKLEIVKRLLEQGLITPDEAAAKRQSILDSL